MRKLSLRALWIVFVLSAVGCPPHPGQVGKSTGQEGRRRPEPGEVLKDPVPLWENAKPGMSIDAETSLRDGYVILDLGDDWVPYEFSAFVNDKGEEVEQDYAVVFRQLAQGEFPKNYHGKRAKEDKYLELYGIPPTLSLLRARQNTLLETDCVAALDLGPLQRFSSTIGFEQMTRSLKERDRYRELQPQMDALLKQSGLTDIAAVPQAMLSEEVQENIAEWQRIAPKVEAVLATQRRLQCEGYFTGHRAPEPGVFDRTTMDTLSEFERRHRLFGWGTIARDTLADLQIPALELERRALLRVLTERAMHQFAVIEDGSLDKYSKGQRPTYTDSQGHVVPVPNLEKELQDRIIAAFGLQTPESAHAWLESLGELSGLRRVALVAPRLPDYYSDDMKLSIEIDRGDVWYEFPFDAEGARRPQPVSHRPRTTIFVTWNNQKIPLARFGTTIGGWRTEFSGASNMWAYKNSPVGARVWKHIASAPVWIPPDTTPPEDLLTKIKRDKYGINYHEMGPSYASAYGLVAAYHRRYMRDRDGVVRLGGDEGVRSHGSVNYMSIMRQFSHGCHRLHNHLALRLMSFVLNHKAHRRMGYMPMDYRREFEYEGQKYKFEYKKGGYFFELADPIDVNVLEGRIQGAVKEPVAHLLPKYNKDMLAYVMPDGMWVTIDRAGNIVPRSMPPELLAEVEARRAAAAAAAAAALAAQQIPLPEGALPSAAPLPAQPTLVQDPAAPSTVLPPGAPPLPLPGAEGSSAADNKENGMLPPLPVNAPAP